MAKIAKQISWLGETDFPQAADQLLKIEEYHTMAGEKGKVDHVLWVRTPRGDLRAVTMWQDNLNKLIDVFGDDPEKWVGQSFTMGVQRRGTKLYRLIR